MCLMNTEMRISQLLLILSDACVTRIVSHLSLYPVGDDSRTASEEDNTKYREYPAVNRSRTNAMSKPVTYDHRISVRKIGELLAGWEFIPDFVSKDFPLTPTLMNDVVVDGYSDYAPWTCFFPSYLY